MILWKRNNTRPCHNKSFICPETGRNYTLLLTEKLYFSFLSIFMKLKKNP